MPNYYNPNNLYPATYYNGYSGMMYPNNQPMQMQQQQISLKPMEWVEGEVGAKAFQMPAGLPANQPVPLWDSTDTVVWLKSWNPMGIPNPLQKLKYELPQTQPQMLPGQSGATDQHTATNTMTKEEFDKKFDELKSEFQTMINEMRTNQNGNNANRGAGR